MFFLYYFFRLHAQTFKAQYPKYRKAFPRLHFYPELTLGSDRLQSYWYSDVKLFNWCQLLSWTKLSVINFIYRSQGWQVSSNVILKKLKPNKYRPPSFSYTLFAHQLQEKRKFPFFLLAGEQSCTYLQLDTVLVTEVIYKMFLCGYNKENNTFQQCPT